MAYLRQQYSNCWHEIISILSTYQEYGVLNNIEYKSLLNDNGRFDVECYLAKNRLGCEYWISSGDGWLMALRPIVERMDHIVQEYKLHRDRLDPQHQWVDLISRVVPFESVSRIYALVKEISRISNMVCPISCSPSRPLDQLKELCDLMNKHAIDPYCRKSDSVDESSTESAQAVLERLIWNK